MRSCYGCKARDKAKKLEAALRESENPAVRKFLKMLIGLLLLPWCWGGLVAVWRILEASGGADAIWVPLVAGVVCWAVVYLLLPRPMWLYVAGHELTHAFWAWLFGGKVRALKVSSAGGHVVVSKTNFLIALAPYFFPFYGALVIVAGLSARLLLPWDRVEVWFLLLLGAAYAFHVTLTGHVLKTRQSDITDHGCIFSGVIILLGNLLGLVLALPWLTGRPAVCTGFVWWGQETARLLQSIPPWRP
ncbi:MAG: hypothetical protein MUE94_09335 [Verrucomicrobia bacterium]|jgi:hypothetical protein|nr:hypothetical protein [Verrucomicrobiota bacterium]